MSVRYPVLYDGHTMTVKNTLHPTNLTVTLKAEPISSATMTIPKTDDPVAVGDWLRIYTNQGDAGVYRIKTISYTATGDRTLNCEHLFGILADWVYFGKYNESAGDKSARVVITDMLKRQPDTVWSLGVIDGSVNISEPWAFNNTTLLNAISTVRQSMDDSQITFDMSRLPFTFNIEKRATEPTCEMRGNRNLDSATVSVDRSRMYTRLYAQGADGVTLPDKNYVSKNEALYGVVSKCETNNSLKSGKALKRWAEKRLARHAFPMVTVNVTGRELSAATGEPWDKLTPGTVCRVPLRAYGETVIERIDSIKWADVLGKPEVVTVTLSNSREDVATVTTATGAISQAARHAGAAKAAADDTSEKVYRLESTKITPMHSWYTTFEVSWNKIQSVVSHSNKSDFGDWITDAVSSITQTASKISLVVGKGKIVGEQGDVSAAVIVDAINNGSVTIKASKINLDSYFTIASGTMRIERDLKVSKALTVGGHTALNGSVAVGTTNTSVYLKGKKCSWSTLSVNGKSYTVLTGGGSVYENE